MLAAAPQITDAQDAVTRKVKDHAPASSVPLTEDVAWLHKFINCTPFGADAPAADIARAHKIVHDLALVGLRARDEALEEAAKVCERREDILTGNNDGVIDDQFMRGRAGEAGYLAIHIRALKKGTP